MEFKVFSTHDYRTSDKNIKLKEINFIGKLWNLRLLWPKLGISLWRNTDYMQIFRYNYPIL